MRKYLVGVALVLVLVLGACGGSAAPLAGVKPMVTACKTIAAGYKTGNENYGVDMYDVLDSLSFPPPPLSVMDVPSKRTSVGVPWVNLTMAISNASTDMALGTWVDAVPPTITSADTAKLQAACAPTGVKWSAT